MSKANSKLASVIGEKKPNQNLVAANNVPTPDTTNKSGKAAYKQDKWLKLLTMLNVLKLQNQYYRTDVQTLKELQTLITECAKEDLYFTCQCIVYSRCLGEGMRTVSHAASVFIAPYVSGQDYAKRFYGPWDKKNQRGGVIYRPDDMSEILSGFVALNGNSTITTTTNVSTGQMVESRIDVTGTKLTNAMKKGFRDALESMDSYSLLKYKSKLIDVINLVRPRPNISQAVVQYEGKEVYTIDAIMKGYSVSADTWEANQSEAGQIVAQAVREGKLTKEEAETTLKQAKSDNWKELLDNNRLGILAAIRNLRNILLTSPSADTLNKLCTLVSNPTLIREGKIMPYQLDLANDIMMSEFSSPASRQISQALAKGYSLAVPNLKEMLPGMSCIFLDQSGSMSGYKTRLPNGKNSSHSTAEKAALIAATIAIATNADIIAFGTSARYIQYNPNQDVFTLAKEIYQANMGGTYLQTAWNLAISKNIKYDRVFILSDNEVNRGSTYQGYMDYVRRAGSPYVYSVDLAGYGTNCIAGENVRYYYGYGYSMFDDIVSSEFNPNYHIDKVKQVII